MDGYIEKIFAGLITIITAVVGYIWKDMNGKVKSLDTKTDIHGTDIALLKQSGKQTDINIKEMGDKIVEMIKSEVSHAANQKEYFKDQLLALDRKIESQGENVNNLSDKIEKLITKYEVLQTQLRK